MLNVLFITALIELAVVSAVAIRWYVKAHSKPQLTDKEIEEMKKEALAKRLPGAYKLSPTQTLVIQDSRSVPDPAQPAAVTTQQKPCGHRQGECERAKAALAKLEVHMGQDNTPMFLRPLLRAAASAIVGDRRCSPVVQPVPDTGAGGA
jgi:hypothetical protein